MIARALSWFTRPDPIAKAADDLQDARCRFAEAHRDHCVATERHDTRRMGLAAVNLRAANTRLIEAERAYEEARA